MATTSTGVITVKAYFLNEVRRFQISTASTFDDLKATFVSFLPSAVQQQEAKLCFLYQDDEEDWCKISNESEFREALRVSKHLLRLKITRETQPASSASNNMNVDSDSASSSSPSAEDSGSSAWPRCHSSRGYNKRSHCPRGFGPWGGHNGGFGGHGHQGPHFGGFHPYYMQQKFANCLPQLIEMFTKNCQGAADASTSASGNNSGAAAAGLNCIPQLIEMFTKNCSTGGATSSSSASGEGSNNSKQQEDTIVHHNIVCDSCNENGIRGTRHKCNQCADYDLCEKCFKAKDEIHDPKHTFSAITNPMLGWMSHMMNNIAKHSAQFQQHYQQQQQQQQAAATAPSSSASSSASAPPKPKPADEPMQEEEIVLDDAADQVLYQQDNGKAPASASAQPSQQQQPEPQVQDAPFNVSLLTLESMGFTNRQLNLHLLKQFNGNVEKTVEALIKFSSYSANN